MRTSSSRNACNIWFITTFRQASLTHGTDSFLPRCKPWAFRRTASQGPRSQGRYCDCCRNGHRLRHLSRPRSHRSSTPHTYPGAAGLDHGRDAESVRKSVPWGVGGRVSGGGRLVYLLERDLRSASRVFLYGWALFSLIQSGSIATLASGFALYVSKIAPLTVLETKILPIACILCFLVINLFGIRLAKLVQNTATIVKVVGIALAFALLISRGHTHLLRLQLPPYPSRSLLLPFGTALIAVLWAYEGWHVVSFTAGEFRHPARDLPRSLFLGTLIVTSIYLLLTVAYYAVLTSSEVSASSSVAGTAIRVAWGQGAMLLISAVILTSILGATNGMILTAPRVYFAMARDGVFLAKFGEVSKRFRVPVFAIVAQGVWASALTLMGSFQQLFTYVVFTA